MPLKPLDESSSPLARDQADQLNRLLSQLSSEQMVWISGYLAAAANQATIAPAPVSTGALAELLILVGSQTGNAEEVAEWLVQAADARGISATIADMADVNKARLKQAEFITVITSTHGEGEPPDNAIELHELLHSARAPKLSGKRFSVLALGDASYEHFCQTGREFDECLAALGAERLHARAECDVDFEDKARGWIDGVLEAVSNAVGVPRSPAISYAPPARQQASTTHSRKNPFHAEVLENILLNARGSDKAVHHIELSLEDSGLSYEPGDAVGVLPCNDPALVAEVIDTLQLSESESLTDDDGTLGEALASRYEITTLTKPLIANYATLAESSRLDTLLQPENGVALQEFLRDYQLIDLLQTFPLPGLTAAGLVRLLRRLPPRLYSIASSASANPDEVHLTVAAVDYESGGRRRQGVASSYLTQRLSVGDTVPVYVDRNRNFKLPESSDTPAIMIGPGTGVAPFRGFLQEREARGAAGGNWLFFGDRRFRTDFLYQSEWLNWRKRGLLSRLDVAFSRDQGDKVYVQHRLRENARQIYDWLEQGAHLYVCGDASRMARDVDETLIDIIAGQRNGDRDQARAYLRNMQKQRRYQRDVY